MGFDELSIPSHSADLSDILHVPNDDAVELEWLSNYMDDSFIDFLVNELTASAVNFHSIDVGRARSKRSRGAVSGEENEEVVRRCMHCASEKTPQWRTGPLVPKTLCNTCGVRYKSRRLVSEYRPAASPTFMLTQHSNSHRKVLELRRQRRCNANNKCNSNRRATDVISVSADVITVHVSASPGIWILDSSV